MMRFIRDKFRAIQSRNDIIGLDIGNAALKCVVLRKNGADFSYELQAYGIEALPHDIDKDRQIKTNVLATHIISLLTKAAISTKHCVIALPNNVVNSKWVRIDYSASENLEIAVKSAIQEHIPCSLDALYFDYYVFDEVQENQDYFHVLLVACRKDYLDARLDVLAQANLIPLCVEVNSHALERAYAYFYPDCLTEPSIVIDVGASQLTCLFFIGNKRVHRYSEMLFTIDTDRGTLVEHIQRFINLFYLSYPHHHQFNKLFFVGSNVSLLEFLVGNLNNFKQLASKLVECKRLGHRTIIGKTGFVSCFPCWFLSCGLALRGIHLTRNHLYGQHAAG